MFEHRTGDGEMSNFALEGHAMAKTEAIGAEGDPARIKGSDEFVEAFAKGLAVIKAFNGAPRPLSMAEIADRANLTRAGARRLLHTLIRLNYAAMEAGRFKLAPRILDLGLAYLSSLTNYDLCHQIIEHLAHETEELCTMSVLDGNEIVYVIRVEGRPALTRSLTVGSRLPAFATSMGRILLAGLPEDKVRTVLLRTSRPKLTRFTKTEINKLLPEIAKTRRNGWSLVKQELELGVCGLSAAVRNGRGETVAAASISFNMARFDEEKALNSFLPKLLKAAAEISNCRPSMRHGQG
jgi:IclR family transcriptional regulator, pca regulon regulatory protein